MKKLILLLGFLFVIFNSFSQLQDGSVEYGIISTDKIYTTPTNTIATGWYIIEVASTGYLYRFFVDYTGQDLYYRKSIDNGRTWQTPVLIKGSTASIYSYGVWYSGWSELTDEIIHIAYTDNTSDDVFYRSLTTSSDVLGTERTVKAYASGVGSYGATLITQSRGGNIYVGGVIVGTTGTVYLMKSTNGGVNWNTCNTLGWYEVTGQTGDWPILAPGWAADNNDIMCSYLDADVNDVTVKFYDDSGDSWSESASILTASEIPITTGQTSYSFVTDTTNNQNLLTIWTGYNVAGGDLRMFKVTEASITETSSYVVNNTGVSSGQGYASLCITGASTWNVIYGGNSAGTETMTYELLYYKTSTDGGANWSAETVLSPTNPYHIGIYGCPHVVNNITIGLYTTTLTTYIRGFPIKTYGEVSPY